jgi:hypothetical protein
VVLVWDQHDVLLDRTAFRRAVNLLAVGRWPVAIVLEMLPADHYGDVMEVLTHPPREAARQLPTIMRRCTLWPVGGYAAMLVRFHERGYSILPGNIPGVPELWSPAGPDVPDRFRRPAYSRALQEYYPYWKLVSPNPFVVTKLAQWFEKHSSHGGARPIAFVLYGGDHLAGYPTSLKARLEHRGYKCKVLVPMQADLELAIRKTLCLDDVRGWIDCGCGLSRPPLITDGEWIQASESEKERFAYFLARVPAVLDAENIDRASWDLEVLRAVNSERARGVYTRILHSGHAEFVRPWLEIMIELCSSSTSPLQAVCSAER